MSHTTSSEFGMTYRTENDDLLAKFEEEFGEAFDTLETGVFSATCGGCTDSCICCSNDCESCF